MLRSHRQNDCSQGVTKPHARLLLIRRKLDGSHRALRENKTLAHWSLKDVPALSHQGTAQCFCGPFQADKVVVRGRAFEAGAKSFYSIPNIRGRDEVPVS